LLGWTVVGWIVALVMACGSHQVVQPVVLNNQVGNQPQPPQGYGQTKPQHGQAPDLPQQEAVPHAQSEKPPAQS